MIWASSPTFKCLSFLISEQTEELHLLTGMPYWGGGGCENNKCLPKAKTAVPLHGRKPVLTISATTNHLILHIVPIATRAKSGLCFHS